MCRLLECLEVCCWRFWDHRSVFDRMLLQVVERMRIAIVLFVLRIRGRNWARRNGHLFLYCEFR